MGCRTRMMILVMIVVGIVLILVFVRLVFAMFQVIKGGIITITQVDLHLIAYSYLLQLALNYLHTILQHYLPIYFSQVYHSRNQQYLLINYRDQQLIYSFNYHFDFSSHTPFIFIEHFYHYYYYFHCCWGVFHFCSLSHHTVFRFKYLSILVSDQELTFMIYTYLWLKQHYLFII